MPRRKSVPAPEGHSPAMVCTLAWLLPGAGHLWLGRRQKGTVFLLALPLMYLAGLWAEGQVLTFQLSQPLVALAALADLGIGLIYVIVRVLGLGDGRVVAVTNEYGNAFLVVAGLLNMLVAADAYDIARGRK